MAADIERLAKQFKEQYPEIADLLWAGAAVARKLGAPESFSIAEKATTDSVRIPDLSYPEIPLSEEHRRQGLILAGRYAERLGLSEEAYIASLPEFPGKPSNYNSLGLTVPIVFETRIPWLEAAELSGIYVSDYLRRRMSAGEVKDWEGINFDMPKVPFAAWVQDGTKFVYRKPCDARGELGRKKNREYLAGPILLAISLHNVRPDMVGTMFWDIIGTSVGSGHVPYLRHWDGEPGLRASGVVNAVPGYRAFVFGREIRTLNLAA